jgi:hypothetical protein
MAELIGDLQDKGFGFFLDENLTVELIDQSIIDIGNDGELSVYFGAKSYISSNLRKGKVFSFVEGYRYLMLDLVEDNSGEYFRNFDNIESMSLEVILDSRRLLMNILHKYIDSETWITLELLNKYGMVGNSKDNAKAMRTCLCEPDRIQEVSCDGAAICQTWEWKPTGYWGTGWPEQYSFYLDFFQDENSVYKSIWEQYIENDYIKGAKTRSYLTYGSRTPYGSGVWNYNYQHDVYPQHDAVLAYRWHYGGFDITPYEMRVLKPEIYNRFSQWYSQYRPGSSTFRFVADEYTVMGYTDIAKTDTNTIYDRQKHIIEDLLGPLRYTEDQYGNRTYYYGDLSGIQFSILYNDDFMNYSEAYINSPDFREICEDNKLYVEDAFFSIEKSYGKLGGRTIFNGGVGNESDYFMPLRDFLRSRGWTFEYFVEELHNIEFDRWSSALKDALVIGLEDVLVRDFTEFYDKDHRAPFDGIEFYCPIVITDRPVEIYKKKAIIDSDGNESIVDSGIVLLNPGEFKCPIDKDEFIWSIKAYTYNTFITEYMKVKISMSIKSSFPTEDFLNFRAINSDYTFIEEYHFEYSI